MTYRKFGQFDTTDVEEYLKSRYDERDEDMLADEFGAPNEGPWDDIEKERLTIDELVERRNAYVTKVIDAMCADDKFERMLASAISGAQYAGAYDMFCAAVRDFEDERLTRVVGEHTP